MECIDLVLVLVVLKFCILLFEILAVLSFTKKKYQHLYGGKNSLITVPRLIQKEIYGQF